MWTECEDAVQTADNANSTELFFSAERRRFPPSLLFYFQFNVFNCNSFTAHTFSVTPGAKPNRKYLHLLPFSISDYFVVNAELGTLARSQFSSFNVFKAHLPDALCMFGLFYETKFEFHLVK